MLSIKERIANLSPAQRALLEQQLHEMTQRPTKAQPISPRQSSDPVPLSFAQQRLWFLHQLYPNLTAYNQTSAYHLAGPLQITALHKSLDELVRRHEVLRTTYAILDEEPVQVINPARPMEMSTMDLRDLPASERKTKIQQIVRAENAQPFDLTKDLTRRARLLCFAEDDHLLLLTNHHIASDGWSNSVFWRELTMLYGAFVQGELSPLPELPIQYADYTLWQRRTLSSDSSNSQLQRLLDYWQKQLAQAPARLELPLDFPRPAEQKSMGKSQPIFLPGAILDPLKALARQEKATLFMLLLATFQLLLMRYSHQTDIIVGTPTANRRRPELEGLIGMFVNTLVLRTDLAGNPSFRKLLLRVRMMTLDAFEHQDLPFEKVVEIMQPERSLSYQPIAQVMFALQNTPKAEVNLAGLHTTRLQIGSETAKFDLSLAFSETSEGLDGRLEYDTALFTDATIKGMADHFKTLLEGIIANPDTPIAEVSLLTAAERQKLLYEWNNTTTNYPKDNCIHELFEAQVERAPHTIALVYHDEQLTYRALNERANQLAHYLVKLGVGPEVKVGIAVERSLEMVVGMVAILKAGGVYVPLDVTYPLERLHFMITDTDAPVLLTQARFAPLFTKTQAIVVTLDGQVDEIKGQPETNLKRDLSASLPAYIIYTSGSTGQPKGVIIPHRAINRLVCQTNYIEIQATDRIAQVSNASFDAATFEIWGALTHGATLAIVPQAVILSPNDFAAYLRTQTISILFLTTALFNQIARAVPDTFATLRVLLFGGEAVDASTVRLVLQQGAPDRFLHVYGPTEGTTFSSWHRVQSIADDAHTIPIGGALANTQLYVLDNHLQPVPVGVAGELYIGGDGLALGYHKQPELTAAQFIKKPCTSESGDVAPGDTEHLYKTGDRVRWSSAGTLEFLGRLDHQVKIRGFRVELDEIEHTLRHHPQVEQAFVIAEHESTGTLRLIGYILPKAARSPTDEELHLYVTQMLPPYMVPAIFVRLERLPLTPNGKVDLAALPKPSTVNNVTEEFVAARDELELQLVRLWEKLLARQPIGIHDNFFALGGHSLLAVQLFEQITKTTGKALPLSLLYQTPTIAQLAAILRQENWKPTWESLAPIQPGGTKPPLFVAPAGGSTVLRFADITRHFPPDQPIFGLEYRGLEHSNSQVAPHDQMDEMAAYYIQQIRQLQPEGPYFLAGICFGAYLMLEVAQQLRAQGQTVAMLAILDAGAPASGPSWQQYKRFSREHLQVIREYWQEYSWLQWMQSHIRQRFNRFRRRLGSQRSHTLPVLAAHYRAQVTYVARPYQGPLMLVQSDEYAGKEKIRRRWQELAVGRFDREVIPNSTHRTLLLQEPFTQTLAESVSRHIEDILSQSTSTGIDTGKKNGKAVSLKAECDKSTPHISFASTVMVRN